MKVWKEMWSVGLGNVCWLLVSSVDVRVMQVLGIAGQAYHRLERSGNPRQHVYFGQHTRV